jgi:hypothetical protein
MAQQIINVGSAPNDGTGDLLRVSQQKANANFTDLYNNKQDNLTAQNLGTFSSGLTTEDAIVDADLINFTDVSDTNKQKKTTWLNLKSKLTTIFNALFVPQSRTLTIGGVTQDLSADRTFSTDVQLYNTISTSRSLTNSDHAKTIYITANCNITIPSGLRVDFNASFRTFTGVTATFLTSGTTINTESDGSIMAGKSMCYLSVYTTNNYIISGGGLS